MLFQPSLGDRVQAVERVPSVGSAQRNATPLHGQHRFVEVALGGTEAWPDRECPGDVRDVVALFLEGVSTCVCADAKGLAHSARIDEDEIAIPGSSKLSAMALHVGERPTSTHHRCEYNAHLRRSAGLVNRLCQTKKMCEAISPCRPPRRARTPVRRTRAARTPSAGTP